MPAAHCPGCSRSLNYRTSQAGRTVDCPSCGQRMQLPAAAPVSVPAPPAFDFQETAPPRRSSSEPWFYWFLSLIAWVMIILGAIGTLIVVGLPVVYFIVWSNSRSSSSAGPGDAMVLGLAGWTWLSMLCPAVVALLVTMFWSALVLLAVDAGRSLRGIRDDMRR